MAKPIQTCLVPTCGIRRHSNGYCVNHFYAWKKHGDPNGLVQKQHHGKTLAERVAIYTREGPGCWLWIGSRDAGGYGRLHVAGTPMLASRASYIVHFGTIPAGQSVLHKCDTPQCVNPFHLFLGTQADNIRDMHEKGRALKRGMKGTEHHKAKLDEAAVRAIRASPDSDAQIAKAHGLARATIYAIRKRRSWAHID